MQELIKVTIDQNNQQVVSARELHSFFGAKERFANWFTRLKKFGFVENVDYVGCMEFNTQANQNLQDYALTLDCAKQAAMLQRNDKGTQARLYFIECERQLKQMQVLKVPKTYGAALLEAGRLALELENTQVKLLEANRTVSILTHVSKQYTATEIAKELGFNSAIEFNKILHIKQIQFNQSGTWVLYSKYSNLGYVDIKQEILDNGKIIYHRRWTQTGREFLVKLFSK
jgi:anti-repressor protein